MTTVAANPTVTVCFTNRAIDQIGKALPPATDLSGLGDVLQYWAANELADHLARGSAVTAKALRDRLKRVAGAAKKLAAELLALQQVDRDFLAFGMAMAATSGPAGVGRMADQLSNCADLLSTVVHGAGRVTVSPGRGRPKNMTAYLVLLDVADMFEALTGASPTRRTNRDTGHEEGPFWDFAAAIWPVVFGVGDDGLGAAIKNWSAFSKRYADRSSLIANFNLRPN